MGWLIIFFAYFNVFFYQGEAYELINNYLKCDQNPGIGLEYTPPPTHGQNRAWYKGAGNELEFWLLL